MEVVAIEHFDKLKPPIIPMAQSHSYLSHEIDQDLSTTTTHLRVLLQFLIRKTIIVPLFTTMWYQTGGWVYQYCCTSAIYLLLCLFLSYSILIERAVGSPGHVKYMVNDLNARDKWLLKLAMAKLLNPKLIWDKPIIFKFM